MKKNILLIVLLGLTCLSPAIEFMKLAEIKPGMEGEGRTIFKGSTIETFKFKVLGVLDKFVSDKNMIIAELFAPALAEGGVIAGMSGSPVYIDGKLIGSVSYGLSNFSKKPIAGITPIEDILKTSAYNTPVASVEISDIKIDFSKENVKLVADAIRNQLVSRMNFSPARSMMPIKLFSSSRGFSPEAVAILQEVFVPLQNISIGKDIDKKKLNEELFTVRPAD
ncbi:MAG: SpoIVB peptidase S55 domain-containing protein, partial [Chrysiogenales bacterium]